MTPIFVRSQQACFTHVWRSLAVMCDMALFIVRVLMMVNGFVVAIIIGLYHLYVHKFSSQCVLRYLSISLSCCECVALKKKNSVVFVVYWYIT